MSLVWCLVGNFNAIRNSTERKGLGRDGTDRTEMENFNAFIDRCQLFDIPSVGRKFTWYRSNGIAKSRLDRVLVSDSWLAVWLGSTQYIQSRLVSDHCAVVVKNRQVDWGAKPFRTFDVWAEVEGYKEVVRGAWEQRVTNGNNLENVKMKLKGLKYKLKWWREQVLNRDRVRKQDIIEQIGAIDHYDDEGKIQEKMKVRRIQLIGELKTMSERENAMMKQKARVEWIEKGDANTKFFHSRLRWRLVNNEIKGLFVNGE